MFFDAKEIEISWLLDKGEELYVLYTLMLYISLETNIQISNYFWITVSKDI